MKQIEEDCATGGGSVYNRAPGESYYFVAGGGSVFYCAPSGGSVY